MEQGGFAIWIIGGLLTVIMILMGLVWSMLNIKVEQILSAYTKVLNELSLIKADIAKLLSWQRSQEKRLDKLES